MSKLLKEVGVTADKENLKQMIKALEGKSVPEHIRAGSAKMSSVSIGGGAASAAPATAAPAKTEAKAEAKKEEPKKVEEEDMDMGDLFGGGDY